MIQLRRVLFATDFSENAQTAQRYACAFAEQFAAELHILHVMIDLPIGEGDTGGVYHLSPAFDLDVIRESATESLHALIKPEWEEDHTVIRATQHGSPFLEIVKYARENVIDLIVVGTHGRTGLSHVLMGSVAEQVVRNAKCPVLTVRPEGHQFVMP